MGHSCGGYLKHGDAAIREVLFHVEYLGVVEEVRHLVGREARVVGNL